LKTAYTISTYFARCNTTTIPSVPSLYLLL